MLSLSHSTLFQVSKRLSWLHEAPFVHKPDIHQSGVLVRSRRAGEAEDIEAGARVATTD